MSCRCCISFLSRQIASVVEVSLTANQPVNAAKRRMTWTTVTEDGVVETSKPAAEVKPVTVADPTITLTPMQIRTFELTLNA